jgi:hypothetical protein
MDQKIDNADIRSVERNGPAEVGTTKARQAVTPGSVRYVLAVSVALVVVAFVVIYFAA